MIEFIIGLLVALAAAYVIRKSQTTSNASNKLQNLQNNMKATQQPNPYMLPQVGFVEGSDWQKMTHSMFLNDSKPYLVPWYDWRGQMQAQCSANNAPIAPRTQQDCPDSSYSYVTDLGKFIPGAVGGGCIQLGQDAQNYCYSDQKGQYHVWWDKVNATSS